MFLWAAIAVYDLLLSQFMPLFWADRFPRVRDVIDGGWLSFSTWLLILAAILVVASFEYALRRSPRVFLVSEKNNENSVDTPAPRLRGAEDEFGKFDRVSFQTIFQPPPWPNDVPGNREFVAIAVRFTFKVTIEKPRIRVTVKRRRNVRWELDPSLVDEHSWYADINDGTWYERDTVDIALAFVGKDMQNHGFTGDWATPPIIVQNNQYLFLVEILSDKPIKPLQLYMSVPSLTDGPQPSRPYVYNGNLFYLQDERYSPFFDGRFDLSANDVPVSKSVPPWVDHPAYQGLFAKDHPP